MAESNPGTKGLMRGKVVVKPKDTKATLKRLFQYMDRDKRKLILAIGCVIMNTVFTLAAAYMIRPIINMLLKPGVKPQDLISRLLFMLVVYLIAVCASYFQSRIMVTISMRAIKRLRRDLYHKLQKLPIQFFDEHNHGDLMSRFTNDVDAVGEMLSNTVVQLISGVLTLAGTFALMVYTNWMLTGVTIVMVPFMMFVARKLTKKSRTYYKKQQEALGKLNGYVEETMTGQKVVKVFGHEQQVIDEFQILNLDLREKLTFAQFWGGIMGPVVGNLGQMNYILSAIFGVLLCIFTGFDVGGVAVFATYSKQFARPLNEISMQMNTIFSAIAGAERVFAVMDQTEEGYGESEGIRKDNLVGDIVAKNVSFGYKPERLVLKNISFYAKPGQKIAFVGSTGAGKTTITNLINRFYKINQGQIFIDGMDINEMNRDWLRENIAMVLQDTHLFSGTVMENIRYGRLDATDEEVIVAAKTANAHHFITRLEDGYQTLLEGDGANLSQGQRQLLNIARAAISKAPILILDEATSSVDTRTERHIEEAMDRLMQERTTLVIAHRLSTVRNANAIMVLENGEILERGSHNELLANKGRYYELNMGASNSGEMIEDLVVS